jgi:hypothetical protein
VARWHRANAVREALWASAALVHDSILGDTGGLSTLVASLAKMVKEVENRINTTAANGVRWGTRSALVVALSHFPELEPELLLLGSKREADLSDDWVDALWPLVSASSNSPASLVPSSLAHDPSDDTE